MVWGRHDLAFVKAGAHAFRRDLPAARIHVLDGGHFVLDTRLEETARLVREFLRTLDATPARIQSPSSDKPG